MNTGEGSSGVLIDALVERAKELNCLYKVEELLRSHGTSIEEMLEKVVIEIPSGWLRPDSCQAKIVYQGRTYSTPRYAETQWRQRADIIVQDRNVGLVEVSYRVEHPKMDDGPFLKEEQKLLDSITDRLGQAILFRQLMPVFHSLQDGAGGGRRKENDWRTLLEVLRISDYNLYVKAVRRMLNHLFYSGVEEAKALFERIPSDSRGTEGEDAANGDNRPSRRRSVGLDQGISEEVFRVAASHLDDGVIFGHLQNWIKENKFGFLIDVLEDQTTSLHDIIEAIARYKGSATGDAELSPSTVKAMNVSLIRRFFVRRLDFIQLAKNQVTIDDFYDLSQHIVHPARSSGRLGGKSAGLFLAAQIIRREAPRNEELAGIKVPKTWYVSSDGITDFIHHNHLEELLEHKYHNIDQIRIEYPNVVQLFKNSSFSPEMINGLSVALDDFEERPLIVRSSTLLEDSAGAAFSGKYKSLFIANQGTKKVRLEALMDAIAEVYASMFNPDAIEYRAERGLLDFQEEMSVIIQEVVGKQEGGYVFPALAGVAFSYNEFRWSPRIRREDGVVRLVPGLGTRAVDRIGDDFPVMVAPGQPMLRVNATVDETIRYAPKAMDVINLNTNAFETVPVDRMLSMLGRGFPRFKEIFSVHRDGMLMKPPGLVDAGRDEYVATFDGLISDTPFIRRIKTLLRVLQEHHGHPVDIEFAVDDRDFYLLQCRTQSSLDSISVPRIPHETPHERTIFTTDKYVSDGLVPNISHIVYVTPDGYDGLTSLADLRDVGRVVSRLNTLLPKRRFILMGPGRWGSRGDIKLGVNVTYSDINNTAALVEIAYKKGDYLPDLSFGTHFFQDLVEASIRYIPLYPDTPGCFLNEEFLRGSENILGHILPQHAHLKDVVRVMDLTRGGDALMMHVAMNAEAGMTMAYLAPATASVPEAVIKTGAVDSAILRKAEDHWRWRLAMAETVAANCDPARFGVKAIYVFGSTKNASAGRCSDIDLIVHHTGTADQMTALQTWFDGWGRCLSEINYLRTGCRTEQMLDVHFVSDEDIANKSSYAVKIGAVSDAAQELPLMNAARR